MSKTWHGKSVVVVDDSPRVRDQMKQAFEEIGMRVLAVAGNGIEAIDAVAKSNPDLVSLDLIMPEMDGVECFRKLRRHFPEVRIVVISWLSSEPKILENLRAIIPFQLFLEKTTGLESLIQKMDTIFGLPLSAFSPVPGSDDMEQHDNERLILGMKTKAS